MTTEICGDAGGTQASMPGPAAETWASLATVRPFGEVSSRIARRAVALAETRRGVGIVFIAALAVWWLEALVIPLGPGRDRAQCGGAKGEGEASEIGPLGAGVQETLTTESNIAHNKTLRTMRNFISILRNIMTSLIIRQDLQGIYP